MVKQALLNIAKDMGYDDIDFNNKDRASWAKLMCQLGVKGIHIAERDTQHTQQPWTPGTFVNTWSASGMISEALQPAELGWGTHEKQLPPTACSHKEGCKSAIYLNSQGAATRVWTWTPTTGAQLGFLITHNEAISISDYFTVYDKERVVYRPTCHYAYHPCDDAVSSLQQLLENGRPGNTRIMAESEIVEGHDELGVLLFGHEKNAYWFGSNISIHETRALAPNQNATGIQVTSAILAGIVWMLENPECGIVEAEEMDFRRCLDIQEQYLGRVFGEYTDWTPLDQQNVNNPKMVLHDAHDAWQFSNILSEAADYSITHANA